VKEILKRVRTRFASVVGVHESPERLAAAWALGIGIGLSPLFGLHTLLALLLAVVLRLNKIDVLLGTLIINPWTLPLYFPAAVIVGHRATGVRIPRLALPPPEEFLHLAVWRDNAPWVRSILLAWGIGAAIFSVLVGAGTYVLLRRLVLVHRRRHQRVQEPHE
jgi:uncharacterized protein (DUF2062 family)